MRRSLIGQAILLSLLAQAGSQMPIVRQRTIEKPHVPPVVIKGKLSKAEKKRAKRMARNLALEKSHD